MNMTKKIIYFLLLIFFIYCIFYTSLAAEGIITGTGVRLRESPDTKSKILTNLYKSDVVNVLEKSGDWYKITFKEFTGYMSKDYITVKEEIKEEEKAEEKVEEPIENISNEVLKEEKIEENNNELYSKAVLEKKVLNDTKVYIIPFISSTIKGTLTKDTKVIVNERINNWSYVMTENLSGWVLNINFDSEVAPKENTVEENNTVNTTTEENTVDTTNTVKENTIPIENNTTPTLTKGYINVTSANIREKASTSSKVIAGAKLNEEVKILETMDEWYKVQVDGIEGYVSKKLISENITAQTTTRSLTEKRQNEVIVENVTNTENIITKEKIEEISQENVKIEKAEEKTETVVETQKDLEKTINNSNLQNEIVSLAKTFLGHKYILGGTTPKGFDCSGFAYYIFKELKVSLPRSLSSQIKQGVFVEKKDLQLGDLLMFTDGKTSRLGHVGIYIGDNKMIHAANPKRGVVIDTIASGYYYKNYIEARRIL